MRFLWLCVIVTATGLLAAVAIPSLAPDPRVARASESPIPTGSEATGLEAATGTTALETRVASMLPDLLRIYRELHAAPEISFEERATSKRLAEELRSLGFDVQAPIGDYATEGRTSFGVVGVLRNGEGPVVLVRTDLDALPIEEKTGLAYASRRTTVDESGATVATMHACGHDVHMTCWLGAARTLAAMKDRFRGTLVFVGQPAEERGAGARALLADGLYERFPKPDHAIALHCSPAVAAGSVGMRPGYALANVDSVDIHVHGRGGHGAYPHLSIDPVVAAAHIVVALQTIVSRNVSPFDTGVVTVGSIHAGTKHNIIPDDAHLQLTVRSYVPEVRATLLEGIRRVATNTARSLGIDEDGIEVRIDEREFTPSTYNDPALTERLRGVFEGALGEDRVVDTPAVMAGEDFSRYAIGGEVPICMFWLGVTPSERLAQAADGGDPVPPLHNARFAPDAEPAIRTGVTALTSAVLSLLESDE